MGDTAKALVLSVVGAGVAVVTFGLVLAQVIVHIVEELADLVVRT